MSPVSRFLSIALILTAAASLRAQEDRGQWVLRTYEVGDLVLQVDDRPFSESLQLQASPRPVGGRGGLGGGGGGGMFNVEDDLAPAGLRIAQFGGGSPAPAGAFPAAAQASPIDRLIDVIVATVDSSTWKDNGGEGEIQSFRTALVVWQSPSAHSKIEGLLTALRQGSGKRKTLMVDARWLLLTTDDLDALVKGTGSVPEADRDQLARLTREPTSIRAITNCFSGQLVYLTGGTRRNSVTSWIPVVGGVDAPGRRYQLAANANKPIVRFAQFGAGDPAAKSRDVGYQPVITVNNSGAVLEVRPTKLEGVDEAVVDLKSTITVAENRNHRSDALTLGPPTVDRVEIQTQELSTTVRMPLGQPVLIGGMTNLGPPPAAPEEPAAGGARNEQQSGETAQLYLVLELR